MHRIYKAEIKNDYKICTTFFNGEVREYDLEKNLSGSQEWKRLKRYKDLSEKMIINANRTRLDLIAGISIDSENLYYEGILIEVSYIDDLNIQIATRLQAIRESMGMTQAQLEKKTGIHQAEISKIERGIGNPSVNTLKRIADATGHRLCISFADRNIQQNEPLSKNAAPYLKAGKMQGEYTIDDVMTLPEDVKVELIDGCIYDMAQPGILHQEISMELSAEIYQFIRKKKGKCKVLNTFALTFEEDRNNYLVPDLGIICDPKKIHPDMVVGAPDFILEIASKSNYRHDYGVKQKIYMEKGVQEYWILDPMKKCLIVYQYGNENDCIPKLHQLDEVVDVNIYKGELKIDLNPIQEMIQRYGKQ